MISRLSFDASPDAPARALRFTDAVRPAVDQPCPFVEGYRQETFRARPGLSIPTLAISVDRDRLFETFLALLEPLGPIVDLVLETSHASSSDRHRDLRRAHIDRPVLESYLCEYEELLMEDGCTGVAVIASGKPLEVQFDEHKSILCYARNLKPFRRVLRAMGIARRRDLRLISEFPHLHQSQPEHVRQFRELALRLGVGESVRKVTG